MKFLLNQNATKIDLFLSLDCVGLEGLEEGIRFCHLATLTLYPVNCSVNYSTYLCVPEVLLQPGDLLHGLAGDVLQALPLGPVRVGRRHYLGRNNQNRLREFGY